MFVVVHLASSYDGRLVVLATSDGSLHCYNAVTTGTAGSIEFSLRWSLAAAHSHNNNTAVVSTDRSMAAIASGPIHSMAFPTKKASTVTSNASDYTLAMVDCGVPALYLYNAAAATMQKQEQPVLRNVACCAWAPTVTDTLLAVGRVDGNIEIYQYQPETVLTLLSTIPPGQESSWCCTHLDWFTMNSLVAGYGRVLVTDDDDENDDDEDDPSTHEVVLKIIDHATNSAQEEWDSTELGDVVPFFSVPKHGRHVFWTATIRPTDSSPLIFVACNVGTDVAVITKSNNDQWSILELLEGSDILCPTDDSDDFLYPTGMVAVANSELALSTTDGATTFFTAQHTENPNYFQSSATDSTTLPLLPETPVETASATTITEPTSATTITEPTTSATTTTAEPTINIELDEPALIEDDDRRR